VTEYNSHDAASADGAALCGLLAVPDGGGMGGTCAADIRPPDPASHLGPVGLFCALVHRVERHCTAACLLPQQAFPLHTGSLLAWLQLGHVGTLWVWMGLAGGLIAIEYLLRLRERARWSPPSWEEGPGELADGGEPSDLAGNLRPHEPPE
jgi:hypothetical protein